MIRKKKASNNLPDMSLYPYSKFYDRSGRVRVEERHTKPQHEIQTVRDLKSFIEDKDPDSTVDFDVYYVTLTTARMETDAEFDLRIKWLEAEDLRVKKTQSKKQTSEYKLYQRLKKKYEKE